MPAKREAPMSAASPIRALYASMPDSLARARRKFGRPLTLSEKILVAHCWDFDSQVWERGEGHSPSARRSRGDAGRDGADGAAAVHAAGRKPSRCRPRSTAIT